MKPLQLNEVLAFRSSLRPEQVGEALFLIGERERLVLSGASTVAVAALIDGRRSVEQVVAAARGKTSEPEALFALQRLVERGHLVPLGRNAAQGAAAFWEGFGDVSLEGPKHGVALQAIAVSDGPQELAGIFAGSGLKVDAQADLRVVVTDDYLRSELAAVNTRAIDEQKAWLLIKPNGLIPFIGPLFTAGEGPCWECLAFWLRGNRPVEELVRRHRELDDVVSPPVSKLGASVGAVYNLAAVAVARILASARSSKADPLHATLFALDLATFQLRPHAVNRRPQCPVCGDPQVAKAVAERPLELSEVEKNYREDGGYRREGPRATYTRFQHLVSPLTGAVSHLVPTPGRDTELRAVYASGYLVSPRNGVPLDNAFDVPCSGKGRGAEQARASALCEALERYSGVYRGDEAFIRASARELGAQALPLAELLQFSAAQYAARAELNRRGKVREFVPEPLEIDRAIDWIPAWSITRNERRYVPLAYCYAEPPADVGTAHCRPCGNGVAAGTCIEEAVLQGLLELVERDAAAIWWYNQLPRPGVSLASFGDAYFRALEEDYARLGWKLWVLDLTHDLRIPAAVALAHEPKADRFSIGFGCHLEPRLAVQRALTELNQVFDREGSRRAPWDLELLTNRRYLFPDRDLKEVEADLFPHAAHPNLKEDILHCCKQLEHAGLEVFVANKTRPDIGLCVAQVLVPGLRHFWPRFAPGRLYEVPVQLGWLACERTEPELNQVPLFV